MPNSYQVHTANGSTTDFSFSQIDGWINSGFLKVYLNNVLQTTGYSFLNLNTVSPIVRFTTAPAVNTQVLIKRETPAVVSGFQSGVVDFNDGSVLTANDLDNLAKGLLHRVQEGEDIGSGALGKNLPQTAWDAQNLRITNMAAGIDNKDAVNMEQFTTAVLYGAATMPQAWNVGPGNGGTTYTLSPAPASLIEEMFIVEVGGVIQNPNTYTITTDAIVFNSGQPSGADISVRNFGISRVVEITPGNITDGSVSTAKLADGAVTEPKLASSAVTTAKIANEAVTYAKMQNVSATNKILGRSSAGAGDVQEIDCTAAGRALLDDLSTTEQRNTLGLQGLALKDTVANSDVAANAAIDYTKLATIAPNRILGNNTASATTPIALTGAEAATLIGAQTASNFATNVSDNSKVGALILAAWYDETGNQNMIWEPGEVVSGGTITTHYMRKVTANGGGFHYRVYLAGSSQPGGSSPVVSGLWRLVGAAIDITSSNAEVWMLLLVRTA